MTAPKRTRGPSQALLRAVERVKCGQTAYAAAKAEGISVGTLYNSAVYRAVVPVSRRVPGAAMNHEDDEGPSLSAEDARRFWALQAVPPTSRPLTAAEWVHISAGYFISAAEGDKRMIAAGKDEPADDQPDEPTASPDDEPSDPTADPECRYCGEECDTFPGGFCSRACALMYNGEE